MKKQAICEYCGKIFEEKDYQYSNDYLSKCAGHEVEHLNLREKFKANLEKALELLDRNYGTESYYSKFEVRTCYDETYYGTDITYSFELHSNKINKVYVVPMKVEYSDKEHIPTTEEIIDNIEKYYIANIKKEYKGEISFEDYCGGHGADDYMLGSRYMRDIFKELKGRTVEIKVLD